MVLLPLLAHHTICWLVLLGAPASKMRVHNKEGNKMQWYQAKTKQSIKRSEKRSHDAACP